MEAADGLETIKGRIFHEAARRFYPRTRTRAQESRLDPSLLRRMESEDERVQLRHAVAMLNENRWGQEWEVVGAELPFAIERIAPRDAGLTPWRIRPARSQSICASR